MLLEAEMEAEASDDPGARVVRNVGVAAEEALLVNQQHQSDVYSDSINESIVASVDSCDDEEIVNSLAMPDFIYPSVFPLFLRLPRSQLVKYHEPQQENPGISPQNHMNSTGSTKLSRAEPQAWHVHAPF